MIRIEYSSMCLNETNYLYKIREAQTFVQNQGFDFGIQIHNSIDKNLFDKLMELQNEIPFSVHSPLFSKYFLNLASANYSTIQENSSTCTPYLSALNTDIFFFHGFFMTDQPIIHDMKNYRKTIKDSISDAYRLNGSYIMNPVVFSTDIYFRYKEIFKRNLKNLKEQYPLLTVALENDFPGLGSGLPRPQEIHELIDNLWFDLGHFWTSSLLHGFDFYGESFKLLDSKNIVGVHLNHNLATRSTEKERLKDSHSHFYFPSEMNLAPIIKKIFEKKIGLIVIEIIDGDCKDLEILFEWIK